MTNNDINELTNFLEKYGVYKVVDNRVDADTVNLDSMGITHLPDNIGDLRCKCLFLSNNKLTYLPDSIGSLQCESLYFNGNNLTSLPDSIVNLKCKSLYLHNNPLTSESIELLHKLKRNGVNVIYQPTKQTNNGCKIMTNCDNVVDPDHYKKGSFQTIDVIEEFLDNESRLLTEKQKYLIGNAIKYLSRAGLKGSTQEDAITDLKKAENYIHRAITGEWIKDV